MKRYACKYQHSFERRGIDTLKIARKVHKDLESRSLEALCVHYQIKNDAAHRAYHDALATAKLYHCLGHYFEEKEPNLFVPEPLFYQRKKRADGSRIRKPVLDIDFSDMILYNEGR